LASSSCLPLFSPHASLLFFFNDTPPSEIYTLSLHDALPIWASALEVGFRALSWSWLWLLVGDEFPRPLAERFATALYRHGCLLRSEEHTSELQSLTNLVCRLLLEKKKNHIDRMCTRQSAYSP